MNTTCKKIHVKLTKHYAMKMYGKVDVQICVILISALVVCEWSASHPGRFTPDKISRRILPVALGSGVYSAYNRNENRKQKNNVSVEQSAAGALG
jgi:hypothetical protein